MSTDCENLLKKFLVLNPAKRASLENIMKDRWMNQGYEEEELTPYIEPEPDFKDHKRIGTLQSGTKRVAVFINISKPLNSTRWSYNYGSVARATEANPTLK